MSVIELLGTVLTELEKVQEKLDRLLTKKVEKDWSLLEEDSPEPRKAPRGSIAQDILDREADGKLPKVRIHSPGFDDYESPKTTVKEEVEQDLAQVLLMKQTEKPFLVVKHGFQVWVAKSHLESAEGYDLGNTYDLKVKEKSKWILDKLDWKPFEVYKN